MIETLTHTYADCQPLTFDGLRFDLPEGRVLLRSSNTEPILRLNVESSDPGRAEELFTGEIQEMLG